MGSHITSLKLTNGDLRFTALGAGLDANRDGAVVLCLHGFPDHARSFRFQLAALGDAGYRAIAPMLRGYEPSSQPADGDYSLDALAGDVVSWVDGLGVEPGGRRQKVHLVGHDWGAAIAYVAGATAPERFHSLTTIAVPPAARLAEGVRRVPGQLLKSWYMTFFQLRGVAEAVVERNDWSLVRRLWRTWSPGFELSADEWSALRATFSAPGVKRAMLAYYRQNASPGVILGLRESAAMGRTTVPVRTLAITGADDGCMDTRLYDHVIHEADFPAGVRIERIEGAGHFVHLEKPGVVDRLILDWIAER